MAKPLKILIIEDDEFMRIFLKDVFWIHNGSGKELYLAGTLSQGRQIMNDPGFKPDIIFLDLRLPEKQGDTPELEGSFRFLEELKSNPQTKDIKVIIFSSFGDKEIKDRAMKLGAEKFLVKGEYLPQEILEIVRETVSTAPK